jgi:hypothetical protein
VVIEVPRVNGEKVVDADEGDRDERNLSAEGEEGRSVEERLEIAVRRSASFREDENAETVA